MRNINQYTVLIESKKIWQLASQCGLIPALHYYVTVPQCAHLYNRVIIFNTGSHYKKSKFNNVKCLGQCQVQEDSGQIIIIIKYCSSFSTITSEYLLIVRCSATATKGLKRITSTLLSGIL